MRKLMLTIAMLMLLATSASFAASTVVLNPDGSDPMPFCRGKNCK